MIRTERLRLKPLNAEELLLAAQNASENHVKNALTYRREMVLAHPDSFVWYTEWALITADEQVTIGGIMLMAERNDREIEIGYGLDEKYRSKGYMTEAVCALIGWMFQQSEGPAYVVAETEKENAASQKVVIRAGLSRYKETGESVWWRIGRDASHTV